MTDRPNALVAADAPPRTKPSNYPEPFASRMSGRTKRPLGDLFGLKNFGVNLTGRGPEPPPLCIINTRARTSSFMSSRANRLCLSTTTRPNFAQAWSRAFQPADQHIISRTEPTAIA